MGTRREAAVWRVAEAAVAGGKEWVARRCVGPVKGAGGGRRSRCSSQPLLALWTLSSCRTHRTVRPKPAPALPRGFYRARPPAVPPAAGILVGKPVIKGTRLAVEFIVDLLAAGWTHERILENYPHLRLEDIHACLTYAAELLHSEHVTPLEPV
ncbi:MAG: DUF433 domain-containing protein [Bryobacteraceae bacterium]